ncbi:MAG: hypothetical protein L3J96_02155 [Thermoplasmata archaeon]|nr:hypothetical protein [Thermoplasmata archaeon]
MSGLEDLFTGQALDRHRQRVRFRRRMRGKSAPARGPAEAQARSVLALVWPTVRRTKPTAAERRSGTWEMGAYAGPYIGGRPPPLYINQGEADHGSELGPVPHLARWDRYSIVYDEACWRMLPHRRVDTIVHEALHAVGFVHGRRGTGRAYQRVVSRTKRAIPSGTLREARLLAAGEEGD